jgi:hypothetical protein
MVMVMVSLWIVAKREEVIKTIKTNSLLSPVSLSLSLKLKL